MRIRIEFLIFGSKIVHLLWAKPRFWKKAPRRRRIPLSQGGCTQIAFESVFYGHFVVDSDSNTNVFPMSEGLISGQDESRAALYAAAAGAQVPL
jgi:hypothetical protein